MHGAGVVGGAGRARGTAPGRKFKGTVRFHGPPELKGSLRSLDDIFSDCSRRFPINRGGEGGEGWELSFRKFFFFAIFGGGEGGGGRVTPKPEAQVARFLVGMFRNRFLEAGVDAKVSPKVAKEGAGDEKVSPKRVGGRKSVAKEKVRLIFKCLTFAFLIFAGKSKSKEKSSGCGDVEKERRRPKEALR